MTDIERLAAFLFRLARDEIGFGVIEDHLLVVEGAHPPGGQASYIGPAGPMGAWARSAARRLVHEEPPPAEEAQTQVRGSE